MPNDRYWRRLLAPFRRSSERLIDDELAFHLEMRVQEYVRLGLSPEAARGEAMRRFGDLERVRAECTVIDHQRERTMRRARVLEESAQDVRYAVRALLRQPAFTAVAALTLALGIGANTAIFSVVNSLLLRPFPSPVAGRLMVIAQTSEGEKVPANISWQNYLDIERETGVLDGALAWSAELVNLRPPGADEGERRFVEFTSGSFFPMLALRPALGRFYGEEEVRQRIPVVVLSHKLWTGRFASDSSVIGSRVTLNGTPFTVIGVAPPRFRGTQDVIEYDMFGPISTHLLVRSDVARMLDDRRAAMLRVWGLRREGTSVAQVRAALDVLAKRIERQYPDQPRGLHFMAAPERDARPEIAVASVIPWIAAVFLALVGLVLLIACVNVANLMLARATARQPEMAVRSALGASRSRLVRQLLMESVVLSVLGLALGVVIGRWVLEWLGGIRLSTDLPVRFEFSPDWRVAAFTTAVALAAGVATGLAPAFQGTKGAVAQTLREGGRGGGSGAARQRMRSALVVAQISVSLVLLICAGLFTRSVRHATRIDLGFRSERLAMVSTDVSFQRYDSTRGVRFYRELVERAAALPGVVSAAVSQGMPLGFNNSTMDIYFDEDVPGVRDSRSQAWYDVVSADYFATLGLPIVAGRAFTRFDTDSSPRVIVVSEAFAKRFYPGRDPIGRRVRRTRDGKPMEIVGVVRDTKHLFISEDSKPFIYRPATQEYRSDMTLLVRTRGEPVSMVPTVRDLVRQLDRDLPVYDAKTMEQHLAGGISILFMRLAAVLAGAVGLLGLVQTVVGLYGVISYGVSQRTREFGIRMALGARHGDVVRGVLRQGARLTAIGLLAGVALALVVTRLMAGLLVGVSTTDVVTFTGAVLLLAAMSLLSTYLPARRAARMQPVDACDRSRAAPYSVASRNIAGRRSRAPMASTTVVRRRAS